MDFRFRGNNGKKLDHRVIGVKFMKYPIATYRLQFNSSFGFQSALEIVKYLKELGITHVYASPILKARKNSPHGYDGVDPGLLNPELGTPEDFEFLTDRLKDMDMGWIQDIVPNHMAYDFDNPALRDLLEHGPNSFYRDFFDTDLKFVCCSLEDKLAAPFLGDHYEKCLMAGQILLKFDKEGFSINYFEFKLPLSIASYAELLNHAEKKITKNPEETVPDLGRFAYLANRFAKAAAKKPSSDRDNGIAKLKAELWEIYQQEPEMADALDRMLQDYNGDISQEKNFLRLPTLLSAQFFRPRFWKTSGDEINYRRFFDINDLISLRQETEPVFLWSHKLLLRLINEGKIDGLRIDHIDGLVDPEAYLTRLRNAFGDIYLVVEKILEHDESLPESWPTHGTTGYDFSHRVESLFVRRENEEAIKSILNKYFPSEETFEEILFSAKKQIMLTHFMGDLDNLVDRIRRLAMRLSSGADITRPRLKAALTEILIRFPVYRTYLASGNITSQDRTYIQQAINMGNKQRPDLLYEFEFLQKVLLKTYDVPSDHEKSLESFRKRAVTSFEKLTAPLMAKGLEDTALYRYPLLLSLNEVGSRPDNFGTTCLSFHKYMAERADKWPYALSSSSTHDSKRGEDVRARLNVLSEIPDQWEMMVSYWRGFNKNKKILVKDVLVPNDAEEYFLYQTLVGSWPVERDTDPPYLERLEKYIVKFLREAKLNSTWHSPHEEYEAGVISFVQRILEQSDLENPFMRDFLPFCRNVAFYGVFNSLSQTLIKMTAPGLPDFFQGSELMNFRLVDPDNRGLVDYEKRKQLIRKIQEIPADDGLKYFPEPDGLMDAADCLKLSLIIKSLKARKQHFELFLVGSYIPLQVTGHFSKHVIAFARRLGTQWSITAVPRFLAGMITPQQMPLGTDIWKDTSVILPSGAPSRWNSIFSDQSLKIKQNLPMGELFEFFPAALLTGD
jgi:(1->4)-alpha-D-glucan 1-alpha-D-glucosylmutase